MLFFPLAVCGPVCFVTEDTLFGSPNVSVLFACFADVRVASCKPWLEYFTVLLESFAFGFVTDRGCNLGRIRIFCFRLSKRRLRWSYFRMVLQLSDEAPVCEVYLEELEEPVVAFTSTVLPLLCGCLVGRHSCTVLLFPLHYCARISTAMTPRDPLPCCRCHDCNSKHRVSVVA